MKFTMVRIRYCCHRPASYPRQLQLQIPVPVPVRLSEVLVLQWREDRPVRLRLSPTARTAAEFFSCAAARKPELPSAVWRQSFLTRGTNGMYWEVLFYNVSGCGVLAQPRFQVSIMFSSICAGSNETA
jgi:hypothetical protein